jgi:hypothetical protein
MTEKPDRLYGLEDAERLEFDVYSVWETAIDGQYDYDDYPEGGWLVEEWTVEDPGVFIPTALTIIEHIVESVLDDGPFGDDPWQHVSPLHDPATIAAAEQLHDAIVATVGWFQAGKVVATWRITIGDLEAWGRGESVDPIYTRTPPEEGDNRG